MKRYLTIFLTLIFAATASAAMAKDIEVKGYTKKDGTVVKGYTKHVKDAADKGDTKTETKSKDESGKETVEVKGYTKKDGTVVKGYTRKKSK